MTHEMPFSVFFLEGNPPPYPISQENGQQTFTFERANTIKILNKFFIYAVKQRKVKTHP